METMNETQQQAALLDAALDAYPLTPLPAGFVRATMARLAPVAPIRFRLHFLDVALPFGSALLMVTLLALFLWLRGTMAPAGLSLPNFEALPSLEIAGVSWAAVVVLILLGEIACLLAGVIFLTWGEGREVWQV
jgi:hypothetical protein